MAGKLFIGFDLDKASATLLSHLNSISVGAPSVWANNLMLPRGVYHNKGAATQDITITPTNNPNTATGGAGGGCTDLGRPAAGAYGCNTSSPFTGVSSTTRATWATAQGYQLGVNRSVTGLGAEFWLTFDMKFTGIPSSTLNSTYLPSADWGKVVKFGDVELACKQTTWNGSSHTVVYSLRNNGSEVATVTVPGIINTYWLFCRIHIKLDAATGLIECDIGGISQSVAYTGQNTVQTTSLASATSVFVGPPIFDNGVTAYAGSIDNIYFDDAAFPLGRLEVAAFTLLADDTLSGMAAYGTSPTTVVNALSDMTDAKAMKAVTAGAYAILTQTPPTTTSYMTDVVGVEMGMKRATNRSASLDRRLEVGYQLSGVQTMGTKSKGHTLPFSNSITPPDSAATAAFPVEQIFETSLAAKMTKTELATMKVVIKSSAP